MCLHFGQSLLAEYLLVLPGANDIGQHDMTVRDSLETMKKVCREEHFQRRHSLLFIFFIIPRMQTMKPHPTHKIETIIVVRSYEISYCDYCGIFVSHPEIEQPCRRRPDLLAKIKRMESLNLDSMRATLPLEDLANS